MLIDTHTHINNVKDLDFLLEKCKENRVTELIAISTDINSSRENIKISKKYENIFCAVGFHPCELNPKSQGEISELMSIASMDECKAIGEIGLDFFHEPFNKKMQLDLFNSQFTIAEELNKPVIIHCRDAYPETISFIESRRPKVDFVFHCFTENLTTAKKIIDLGGYLSFTGIITFKKSIELRNLLKEIPLNSFMIETDSPYLSPEPYRGKENNSSNLIYIAECVSESLNISFDKACEVLRENSKRFFNL